MGKSMLARALRRWNIPVFDADAAVRKLMATPPAALSEAFPEMKAGIMPARAVLVPALIAQPERLMQLEAILHPLLARQVRCFLREKRRQRCALVVIEAPLLFEAGWQSFCDFIILVSAPAFLQRQRLRARAQTSVALFALLSARQWSPRRQRQTCICGRYPYLELRCGLDQGRPRRHLHALSRQLRSHRHAPAFLRRRNHGP